MGVLFLKHAVLVCALIVEFALSTTASDSFVCKKADEIHADDGVQCVRTSDAERRILALERRVEGLEQAAESRTSSDRLPNVIKLAGDSFPKDCVEILRGGETADGVYTVSPDGMCPFDVYCDMANGGWTLIQQRRDGSVNFRRNWRHYVDGFGDFDREFWLGLEKIHRLTTGGSQIYFGLESHDGRHDYAHYESFVVHGVTSAYRMNVDQYGYNGSIPDLLSYHDNLKFSTYDRDNDDHSANCCEMHGGGGGWWYKDCYRLGLVNAVYGKQAKGGIGYWDKELVYMKNTVIKVKPRKGMCNAGNEMT